MRVTTGLRHVDVDRSPLALVHRLLDIHAFGAVREAVVEGGEVLTGAGFVRLWELRDNIVTETVRRGAKPESGPR